ncbi:hypothetical protein B4N89_15730 [Embleya scabrispora]|uniref:Uncharacterized protein n=1 Tax=Embleya scabrispora TaxID=159449 RepID=A0A1T3NZP9_9ACTN|nr:hypothetical protein [Embleya scabrispora]OPC82192.1 hypothetical protein B4N89_15730 [Embleya scabrispora]
MSPAQGAQAPGRDGVATEPGRESTPPEPAPTPGDPETPAAREQLDHDDEGDTGGEHAWDSRRDLYRHSPGIMLDHSARLGGSLVGGDQHGVSGGHVTGDVILGGSKIEYHLGGDGEETSGEIPVAEVEALALSFVHSTTPQDEESDRVPASCGEADGPWRSDSPFGLALDRLRRQRVAVISGPATTGRRTAALMLLRAAGSTTYRALDPALSPGRYAGELRSRCGHLLADFATSAERPLREHHVRALSEKLHATESHLVIVVGPHPVVQGVDFVSWQLPEPDRILCGHLRHKDLGGRAIEDLLALPAVRSVLAHRRPVAELARFADRIAQHACGALSLDGLAMFGYYAAERQVRRWFDGTDQTLHDKAFLVALAAFDEAPYALTAELSDALFGLLQRIENPDEPACIPVFGTSSAQRVELAQADRYQEAEQTEWGPVLQTKIQFRDRLTAITLLREVWTGHPSARPAMVAWLRRLAFDPRPLVRNRAASTTAVLAQADLPSTMALLIQPWAADRRFRARLAAASALALAHHLGAPHVPHILREWCAAPDHHMRRTAVRTYALVGETFPGHALTALIEAVRALESRGSGPARAWPEEIDEIAQSAATLLLAADQYTALSEDGGHADGAQGTEVAGGPGVGAAADTATGLWPRLVPLTRHSATREFALRTVIHACGPTDGPPDTGRPLLLDLFARARSAPATPGAFLRQSLAALWRSILNDPMSSVSGLEAMRRWIRAADRDPDAERALAELLPMLAVTAEDAKRLVYLVDNLRGGDSEQVPPAVARRLRATLPVPGPSARPSSDPTP